MWKKRKGLRPSKPEGIEGKPRKPRDKKQTFNINDLLAPLDEIAELGKGLFSKQFDDITLVISATTLFDNILSLFITMHIGRIPSQNEIDNIFSYPGPLSSFSSKIDLCFLMGHLSEEMKHDLDQIRWIRNRFCHSVKKMSLADDDILRRCKSFKYGVDRETLEPIKESISEIRDRLDSLKLSEGRLMFSGAVIVLMGFLIAFLHLKREEFFFVQAHKKEIATPALAKSHEFIDRIVNKWLEGSAQAAPHPPQG